MPYLAQLKTGALIFALIGTAGIAFTVGTKLERARWLEDEQERNYKLIEDRKFSERLSADAGKRYEAKRKVIQRKLITPDKALDERIKGTGDVVMPGELGLRLNALSGAVEASSAASKPD